MRHKNFNRSLKPRAVSGFSFTEVMAAVAIAGVITVVGLNSYRKQRHQARSAQAQYSLSNIYAAEKNFKSQWDAYHENLYIIGAIPEGEIWYDAGFNATSYSTSDGNLGNFPWNSQLDITQCGNFHEICEGTCATKTAAVKSGGTAVGKQADYTGQSCKITGDLYVKDKSYATGAKYEANATTFTAVARGKLNKDDEWTIDEGQNITHTEDGTGN